jgi:hypothetical protein
MTNVLNRTAITLAFAFVGLISKAQTPDLLGAVGDATPKKERVKYAFKSPRVIQAHSMEFLNPGTMDFRILHRFGLLNQGVKNFFGLDQATMRIGLDFGIRHNLMAGIGRSTYKKELDGYVKYAPVIQSTGPGSSPVTVALIAGMTVDGMPWENPARENFFSSRLAYYGEVIIGRKFNDKFTLQVSPTIVHKNLVQLITDKNDIIALGIGGRYKVSKRVALTWDYAPVLVGRAEDSGFYDPISIGVDIETGGHVFQLHFSNSTGMNERAFITETTERWGKGQVRFGFNLSRVFQLKKRQ